MQEEELSYRLYEDPAHFLPWAENPFFLSTESAAFSRPSLGASLTMRKDLSNFGPFHDSAGLLLFGPSFNDRVRGVTRIAQESLGHSLVSRGAVVLKLTHVSVVRLYTHAFDTLHLGGSRALIHNHLPSALDIRGQGLVEEVNVEAAHDFDEEAVDVLQRLVVRSQDLDEMWRRVKEFPRQDGTADILQQEAPFGDVRAIVGSTQEQNTIRRHEDRPKVLDLFV